MAVSAAVRNGTWNIGLRVLPGLAAVLLAGSVAQAQDMAAARQQFVTSCGTCHVAEPGAPHRQGPNLHGIFGAKAGQIADFKYSPVLKAADLTWDGPTLDRWIENAQAVLPGTTMAYRQANADRRALVVAYLKSLGPAKQP